ncbi:MAG: ferredoxin family protein [Lachnospiraceae bacterium]|nr:ferredoxin family protein [Lachnospiraceae bacterium]
MSIRIDQMSCIGCGRCTEVCPGSLIEKREGKAFMAYERDCWGCVSCVKECPVGAIDFFLGADIGGNGSKMRVSAEGHFLHWIIEKRDGTVRQIDVDRQSSNKY